MSSAKFALKYVVGLFLVLFLVPLIPAFICRGILNGKMKSVYTGTEASAYVVGGLNLTRDDDIYTHTTRSERYIEPDDSSDSSSTDHSGSASGTSGKF